MLVDPRRIHRLHNWIQTYPWGSHTAIQDLLGVDASAEPWAELWMGAHPSAPSRLLAPAGWIALDAWIARDPEAVLGAELAQRFGGRLPFLFKALAADQPLSIQAHPDLAQARAGFARENAAGVPLDAPRRCYRDAQHKPELVCALTRLRALNGFREPQEIVERLRGHGAPELADLADALAERPDLDGVRECFRGLMSLDAPARARVLAQVAARAPGADDPALSLCGRLAQAYPDDLGALAPLLLNLIELAPGDAMFLSAGELHGYLEGFAVELMANSDNVLRGGLTSKHVDVPELLGVLTGRTGPVEVLRPQARGEGLAEYETSAREFALGVVVVAPDRPCEVASRRGVEILLCTRGPIRVVAAANALRLERGASALVPARAGAYRVEGSGTLYRASAGSE